MKKSIYLILLICAYALVGKAQKADVPPIFQNQQPLTLSMSFSIKEVKKNTVDSVYIPSKLKFKNDQGVMDSIPIRIRARGNFRRANCYFPPIRMKMKKGDAEKTIFTGNKDFKLVLPCQTGKASNDLIMKEYLCYKLLEPLTPYHFHTRLADVVLTDVSGKSKTYTLKTFLIEDDDLVAHRFHGKIIEQQMHPMALNDTASVINDLFQYLVANTDWSTAMQHNMKVIQIEPNKKIPLAYDFDMAGLVNAPYATVNETLGISNVQERLYRGFCRSEATVQYVRSEYLRLEPELMKVISDHQSYFSSADYNGIKKYVEEFYATLKNDKKFKESIILGCRTK
jgi:hypothetical protein